MFKISKKNKLNASNKKINNSSLNTNKNSYRFKEILKYKKNDEHLSDKELTIKYDIVKPEIQYKNFYESWIEKNIGSDEKEKNIRNDKKSKNEF